MKRNKLKGNESFLALVLSDKRTDFRDILINLGPHLKEMDNNKNPEKWNLLSTSTSFYLQGKQSLRKLSYNYLI